MADDIVQGMSALVDNLNRMPLDLSIMKNIIVRCLRLGALPIQNRASELAPVYQGQTRIFQRRRGKVFRFVVGQVRDSMTTVVSDQTATGAVAKIGPAKVGFYGAFDEYGTAHQPARPWLRRAWDEKIDEAVAIIEYEMGRQIEKELAKAS